MKIHELEMKGQIYQIGYKVVTEDLKSTGLRKHRIVQFDLDDWNESRRGTWSARIPSFAKYVRSWMKHRYKVRTRTFIVALDDILEVTKNGVRAKRIKFLKELDDNTVYDMEKVL